ncbi:unnamed protein product, partial [Urochloa humidicola]
MSNAVASLLDDAGFAPCRSLGMAAPHPLSPHRWDSRGLKVTALSCGGALWSWRRWAERGDVWSTRVSAVTSYWAESHGPKKNSMLRVPAAHHGAESSPDPVPPVIRGSAPSSPWGKNRPRPRAVQGGSPRIPVPSGDFAILTLKRWGIYSFHNLWLETTVSAYVCVSLGSGTSIIQRMRKTLLHANMVLIDEKGNNIHAQIYPPNDEKFRKVEEGSVYIFYYFQVKNCSGGNYKPVANDQMLNFSKWTNIEKAVEIPAAFPMYAYSLASMEQLQAHMDTNKLFSDVIGVITAISTVGATRTKVRPGESLRRSITIQVPSGGLLDVVLWSEQATTFPAEEIHRNGQASPQIVIFVGTLVKSFGGMSLSSGSSCKWYINPEVPEAKELMASAKTVHVPIAWAESKGIPSAPRAAVEEKKISDIKNLNPFECK